MQLYCYRIHLHSGVTDEIDFDGQKEGYSLDLTRESYIRGLFSQRIDCREVGSEYVYDHEYSSDDLVGGVFGKPKIQTVNDGPESDWESSETSNWNPQALLVDPTEHPDGQLVFVEGTSNTSNKRFIDAISKFVNESGRCPWRMEASLLYDKQELQSVLSEYRNQVSTIKVSYPPVNMPSELGSGIDTVRTKLSDARAKLELEARASSGQNIDTSHESISDILDLANQSGAQTQVYIEGDESSGGHEIEVFDSANTDKLRRIRLAVASTIDNVSERLSEIADNLRNR